MIKLKNQMHHFQLLLRSHQKSRQEKHQQQFVPEIDSVLFVVKLKDLKLKNFKCCGFRFLPAFLHHVRDVMFAKVTASLLKAE
jgi:hypothetical protein